MTFDFDKQRSNCLEVMRGVSKFPTLAIIFVKLATPQITTLCWWKEKIQICKASKPNLIKYRYRKKIMVAMLAMANPRCLNYYTSFHLNY